MFLFLFFFPLLSNGQDIKRAKLIGGMYFGTGYLNNINVFTYGLGGKLAFRAGKNFRIGAEGYGSSAGLDRKGSFYSLNWGGVLGEFYFPKNKHNFIFGISVGGGSNKEMRIINQNDINNNLALWREEKSFIITPFISYEYALSNKANLSVKMDYISSFSGNLFHKGIRIYIGCLFNMVKD